MNLEGNSVQTVDLYSMTFKIQGNMHCTWEMIFLCICMPNAKRQQIHTIPVYTGITIPVAQMKKCPY